MPDTNKNKHGTIQVKQSTIDEIEARLGGSDAIAGFDSKLDEVALKKIYRAAKTPDELRQDAAQREQLFVRRIPRRAVVKIACMSTLLFAGILVFAKNLEALWFFGQLAGIAFSFVVAMLIPFLYIWLSAYTDRIFYLKGRAFGLTVKLYIGGVIALLVASGAVVSLVHAQWSYSVIGIVSLIHFAFVALLLAKILKQS